MVGKSEISLVKLKKDHPDFKY